jgi:hypothetical protein
MEEETAFFKSLTPSRERAKAPIRPEMERKRGGFVVRVIADS